MLEMLSTKKSLDEAIQEGILRMVRAADRYDPSHGLWFSMYCT
jgi:DNA-directed RNA polymerase sigma subunit (sigma70/sigma32)